MIKKLTFIAVVMSLMACSSDKNRIETYLENNFADREIEIDGDIVPDSVFCALGDLDNASIELISLRDQLLQLLNTNPDSAFKFAKVLSDKFADGKVFANYAYPKGKNNREALMVKCKQGERKRMIAFYKLPNGDDIEACSFDEDDARDSLLVTYNKLLSGIKIILEDSKSE